ncbi:MAG: isoprenyl transferase [Nitrospirota bacterium]
MKELDDTTLKSLSEEDLFSLIDTAYLPQHIAIIMDGNGRWANRRGLPRIAGHREGIKSVREIITFCRELNIPVLTLYAFSVENWNRPKSEIQTLMRLLKLYLKREMNTMMKNNIRFNVIGRIENLPQEIISWIELVKRETQYNNKMILTLALSYGGRTEIVDTVNKILNDIVSGEADFRSIDENIFSDYLYTHDLPDPDLLIRTSGESRISNFLLWQIAYTELYFTKTLWPDFRKRDMLMAIINYQQRERRFGLVGKGIAKKR